MRNRTSTLKIAKFKERDVGAIEIDLSGLPWDETKEFYEDAMLRDAGRRWLHDRHVDAERLRMRTEAEQLYGHVADKAALACEWRFAESGFCSVAGAG